MLVKERRCDLCDQVIIKDGRSLIGSLKIRYKAKRAYRGTGAYKIYYKWEKWTYALSA